MGNKVIRFGIVGCGYFGGGFARILHEMAHTKVVAVHGGSGKSAKSVAAEIGCEYVEHLEQLIDRDDVDAVIVASPNHAHKEPVLLAACYGKHVFCEKPVALTLADCQEMIDACKKAGVLFMAGHIMHFIPGMEQVKRWVAEGKIGRPIVWHSERTGWEKPRGEVSWKKMQQLSGGHLFHHIHELDMALSIMGPAHTVYMAADNLAHRGSGYGDEDDVLLMTLRFASGSFGTLQYGSGFRWGEHYIKINGTEGAIKIDFKQSRIELQTEGQKMMRFGLFGEPFDEERREFYRHTDGGVAYGDLKSRLPNFLRHNMTREISYFCDVINGRAIDEEKKPLFDGTAAIRSVATAEAALASSKMRQVTQIRNG